MSFEFQVPGFKSVFRSLSDAWDLELETSILELETWNLKLETKENLFG